MGKRTDLSSIMVIGSGPIVIGQACEFDYSGTQACRVLRQEGYRVILVNPNPATIMTDPDLADATYVEPLDLQVLTAILEKERPDAILPTLGGQTALNAAMMLSHAGVLDKYQVELIGASAEAIETAENRERFKDAMTEIGIAVVESGYAHTRAEALEIVEKIGLPVIVRPSYILGGSGTGIANSSGEVERVIDEALAASPISEILIERSIVGWKEYELEVMRDRADNCVIICSIENFDAMGVHTGDSITVAPAQTLSDVEYQMMRDASFACIRRIGVETGGSNIQFAINPQDGSMVVIEMNPRVSRSSALASKATGFPIAKIATKLAIGYCLDEIVNDITGTTPASFEPTIDYVVTKIPRWAFEKFPDTPDLLGTRMQSVGEVMAIGRTFPESFQKALRSLETARAGLNCDPKEVELEAKTTEELLRLAVLPNPERPFQLEIALRRGVTVEDLSRITFVDPWFLDQLLLIVETRAELETRSPTTVGKDLLRRAKRLGFSDIQLAWAWRDHGATEDSVRALRLSLGVLPVFKTVDTCGAEFQSSTPYHYSTYDDEDELTRRNGESIIILGSGPNRIGQGIEFDYCCVHASFALHESGYETVMVNCNPETVSTDYDTSDRLYFEPITYEDVSNIIESEQRTGRLKGVIVSLGGQTPLKLSNKIDPALVMGTSPASIDLAEDRDNWGRLCSDLGIPQPPGGAVFDVDDAAKLATEVGYPVLVRPSYVLGGRAMEIVYDEDSLRSAFATAVGTGDPTLSGDRPVLVDRFLEDAIEVDVDAIRDSAGAVVIGGVMEHVEEAGVHSGDSACVIPPPTLSSATVKTLKQYTEKIAHALEVQGLVNVQFAVRDDTVFVIEANPRASRTVPFVSKATGITLAKVAARVMAGENLADILPVETMERLESGELQGGGIAVKEAVLPFDRFPEADSLLGPEMRSTGEVMGIDVTFGLAFAKSQISAGNPLPSSGQVFFSLADRDKEAGLEVAIRFVELGFTVAATAGTAEFLTSRGVPVETVVAKIGAEGGGAESRPGTDPIELLSSGLVNLVVNTPRGRGSRADGAHIRRAASRNGVACITTVAAARAAAAGIQDWGAHALNVRPLQDYHSDGQQRLGL